MANADSFKPQGGQQIKVLGSVSPQLNGGGFSNDRASVQPMQSQQPSMQPAQIGAANAPKGAQPVALAGQPQQQPQLQPAPRLAQAAAPQPYLARNPNGEADVFTVPTDSVDAVFPRGTKVLGYRIAVEGVGPDGKKYVAEYERPV